MTSKWTYRVSFPSSICHRELAYMGYLAHKKTPAPLGPPQDPWQRPTEGS